MKEKYIFIISIIIGLILYFPSFKMFYGELVVSHLNSVHSIPESCENGMELPDEICEEYNYYLNTYGDEVPDAFTGFYWTITDAVMQTYIFMFVICFVSIYSISREFKGKTVYSYLQRNDYKSYLKRIFKIAYKYMLYYIPLFIIIFILCVIFSKGSFNIAHSIDMGFYTWPIFIRENIINIILYFVNFIFICGILISVSLLFIRKFVNPIIAATSAFLSSLVLSVGLEVLGSLLFKWFGFDWHNYLNIFNAPFIVHNDNFSIWIFSLIIFGIFLLLFVIVCLVYKNKEKFVIALEKHSKE